MRMLESIESPQDLKPLSADQLLALATDIRDVLIETVSRTSGHLGPNLGVVELTIALHRVFDSPSDRIVFDTGHQSYVHKLLTGRYPEFGTLRQRGGLATNLAAVRVSQRYEQVLEYIKTSLSHAPLLGPPLYDTLHGIKKGLKDVLQPQVLEAVSYTHLTLPTTPYV